jgi:hypothetical protein
MKPCRKIRFFALVTTIFMLSMSFSFSQSNLLPFKFAFSSSLILLWYPISYAFIQIVSIFFPYPPILLYSSFIF